MKNIEARLQEQLDAWAGIKVLAAKTHQQDLFLRADGAIRGILSLADSCGIDLVVIKQDNPPFM